MNLNELLHLSLKNDLISKFKILNLDKDLESRVHSIIDHKISQSKLFETCPHNIKPNKCHARIWNKSYGAQCSRNKSHNKSHNNLCNVHYSQFISCEYGIYNLRLSFYNEPKPLFDFNKDGSHGKKRLWKLLPREQIDKIIQSQHNNLSDLISL